MRYKMTVICFGDSNTYGYDPRGYFGGRYDADCRWVDILATETGWTISNIGQNGREIPSAAPVFPADTDLHLRLDANRAWTPLKSQQFAKYVNPDYRDRIAFLEESCKTRDDSRTFARLCRVLAERMGIRFADAGKWDIPLAYDGVHFTEQGHRVFAAGLLEELR